MTESLEKELTRLRESLAEVHARFEQGDTLPHYIAISRNDHEVVLEANSPGLVYLAKELVDLAMSKESGIHVHLDEAGMADRADPPLVVAFTNAPWDQRPPSSGAHHPMTWYSARILYETEIDGRPDVDGIREESIRVLRAESAEAALSKARKIGRLNETTYQNHAGENVTWRFRRVLEVQDLCEHALREGVEVFSVLSPGED